MQLWKLSTAGVEVDNKDGVSVEEETDLEESIVNIVDWNELEWSIVFINEGEDIVSVEKETDLEESIVNIVENESEQSIVFISGGEGTEIQFSGKGGRGNCVGESNSAHSVS